MICPFSLILIRAGIAVQMPLVIVYETYLLKTLPMTSRQRRAQRFKNEAIGDLAVSQFLSSLIFIPVLLNTSETVK